MTHQIISTSEAHAANRRAHRPGTWLTILSLLVIISLGCSFAANPTKPRIPTKPGKPAGFEKTDCSVAGITFPDITVSYNVDDTYDGGYLICNYSGPGAQGSVTDYISVMAYKADKLNSAYNDLHASIQGFVDQANEWNSALKPGDPLIDTISDIRNDNNRYVIVISSVSNVQNCYRGYGYGAEKVMDKYLVHIGFESCEEGDTAAYTDLMDSLEYAALTAIERVEGVSIPIP